MEGERCATCTGKKGSGMLEEHLRGETSLDLSETASKYCNHHSIKYDVFITQSSPRSDP